MGSEFSFGVGVERSEPVEVAVEHEVVEGVREGCKIAKWSAKAGKFVGFVEPSSIILGAPNMSHAPLVFGCSDAILKKRQA